MAELQVFVSLPLRMLLNRAVCLSGLGPATTLRGLEERLVLARRGDLASLRCHGCTRRSHCHLGCLGRLAVVFCFRERNGQREKRDLQDRARATRLPDRETHELPPFMVNTEYNSRLKWIYK